MTRTLPATFVLLLLMAFLAQSQQRQLTQENTQTNKANSDGRVALVIGNGAYETSPLKNPVNDSQDMAQSLRELGFDVIYKENLNQNDMKRAIREFGAKLRGGGVGLFYYAGHGVQVKGTNYLVPVDAKVESEEEVEYECVDAGFVLAQMESAGNYMNIVILDACRNNPFTRSFRSVSRGLAQMDAPSGTLIAYATAPGSLANDGNLRNGLYTQELLKNIRTPGLGIEEVFKYVRVSVSNLTKGKQTPWESTSLTGDFYISGKKPESGNRPEFVRKLRFEYIPSPGPITGSLVVRSEPNSTITIVPDGIVNGVGQVSVGERLEGVIPSDKSFFIFNNLSPGTYRVISLLSGSTPKEKKVRVVATINNYVSMFLTRPTFAITISTDVNQANVKLYYKDQSIPPTERLIFDGRAEIEGLESGEYIGVIKTDSQSSSFTFTLPGNTNFNIKLKADK